MSDPSPAPVVSAPDAAQGAGDEPPPVLTRWRNVYLVVLAELALLVGVFYALTRWAS